MSINQSPVKECAYLLNKLPLRYAISWNFRKGTSFKLLSLGLTRVPKIKTAQSFNVLKLFLKCSQGKKMIQGQKFLVSIRTLTNFISLEA